VISGMFISGFLAIAGGSAPINRAAIVSIFGLLSWYYGRQLKPLLLLLLSGAITAFASPFYIWGDPGWYLSFLAFGGVLILAPTLNQLLFKKQPPAMLVQILVETLSAQLCTLPYSLYLFGGVSVIAPLANVLILPFVPFVMALIFLVGIVGIILPGLAIWISIVPRALITLQLWVIEKLSGLSWAHADIKVTAMIMVAMFAFIVSVATYLHYVVKRSYQAQLASRLKDLI